MHSSVGFAAPGIAVAISFACRDQDSGTLETQESSLLDARKMPDGAAVATLSEGGQTPQEPSEQSALSPRERVELFRRLFRGRTDTFPIRWHSATSGKSGYAPACSNEWVPGVCEKPRVKCADCENRKFIALSDQVIFERTQWIETERNRREAERRQAILAERASHKRCEIGQGPQRR